MFRKDLMSPAWIPIDELLLPNYLFVPAEVLSFDSKGEMSWRQVGPVRKLPPILLTVDITQKARDLVR
jgi:hypothetical protein